MLILHLGSEAMNSKTKPKLTLELTESSQARPSNAARLWIHKPSFLLHGGGVLLAEKITGYTPESRQFRPDWTGWLSV